MWIRFLKFSVFCMLSKFMWLRNILYLWYWWQWSSIQLEDFVMIYMKYLLHNSFSGLLSKGWNKTVSNIRVSKSSSWNWKRKTFRLKSSYLVTGWSATQISLLRYIIIISWTDGCALLYVTNLQKCDSWFTTLEWSVLLSLVDSWEFIGYYGYQF